MVDETDSTKTTLPTCSKGISAMKTVALMTLPWLVLTGFGTPSHALDIKDLRLGSYVERSSGCQAIGSAAGMTFDGRNFSGHYQMCRTEKLSASRVRQTCIEAQGPKWPDLKEIDVDPDRVTSEVTVIVQSATTFTFSGRQYRYCGN